MEGYVGGRKNVWWRGSRLSYDVVKKSQWWKFVSGGGNNGGGGSEAAGPAEVSPTCLT